MKLKTIALGAAFAMALPFAANAATCDPISTNKSVAVFSTADTADCGEYDISEGVISVIGTFDGDIEGAAILEFDVFGAPRALGSVDVNISGSVGDVTGTFGGSPIDFEEQDGDLTARLSSALPAMLQIVFTDATDGSNFNLNLTPVPVPAAGFLLLGALGGLAALRRKS